MLLKEIIIKNSRLNKNSIISQKNIIYNTINNMSSVGYKINKPVLDFILLNNDKFNLTLIKILYTRSYIKLLLNFIYKIYTLFILKVLL